MDWLRTKWINAGYAIADFETGMNDSFRGIGLRVKNFFTPSDYTREMFSTVSRGWVAWQAIIIAIMWVSTVLHLLDSEWLYAWYAFLIGALFVVIAFQDLILNMARKTIESLFEVARDQQKTMHQMLDDFETISGVSTRNSEEFD